MGIKLKSKDQIQTMHEGGRRHAEILRALSEMVTPGISTLILEEEALRLIKAHGDKPAFLNYSPRGAKRPFPAALCVSINDEIVHGIPNEKERILKEGDIVSLDLGLNHEGFITDSAVTVPVGKVDDEARDIIRLAREALEAGIRVALPGAHVGDIGYAIHSVIKGTPYSLADDLAGHGVGFEVHEDPFVPNVGRKGEGEKLVAGMVIAIEPMVNAGGSAIADTDDGYTIITADGSRSAHFEHTIAITEEGNIILTQ